MNKEIFKKEEMKSGIKLAFWVLFIVIVLVFLSTGDTSEEDSTTDNTTSDITSDTISYEDRWENLLEENYKYKYIIKTDSNTYIYEGYKCLKEEYGYKESSDGIIKYYVDESGTYSLVMGQEEVLDNLYEEDYFLYLDLSYLYDEIKDYSYLTEENDDITTLTYTLSDKKITIIYDTDNITNINIESGVDSYTLEFTNIGNCANIVFTD